MTFTRYIAFVLLFNASAALGASVSLAPLEHQDASRAFRVADMTVTSDLPDVIRGISLHWRGGGPAFIYPAAIAPGTRQTLQVQLSALSQNQLYDVRLLTATDESAKELAHLQTTVSWPQELVNASKFSDLRYQTVGYEETNWPPSQKRNIFITLAVGCVLLAGLFLIRSAPLRVAALVILTAGLAIACIAIVRSWPLVTIQDVSLARPGTAAQPLRIVSCRRTTRWQTRDPLVPLYLTRRQMEQDGSRILAGELSVDLQPGDVRLFQVGGR